MCPHLWWNLKSIIVKLSHFTLTWFTSAPALQHINSVSVLLWLTLGKMVWRLLSWHHQSTIFNGLHPRGKHCMFLVRRSFPVLYGLLEHEKNPSCELNNQHLPFWQPWSNLVEDKKSEIVHVFYEKNRKKIVCSIFEPLGQMWTEPFSPFTNFFSFGWQLVAAIRRTNVNWERHPEIVLLKGVTALGNKLTLSIFRMFFECIACILSFERYH